MANTLLTAKGVSSLAVALLTRTLVLPMTVSRIPGGEYGGPNGGTITVRVRTPRAARTQASPGATITYDDLAETPVDVTLAHLYDAARLTEEDLSLSIEDFGAQVTQPQVASVGIGAEDQLATAMNAITADAVSITDVAASLQAAREALTNANVPASERYVAVAPDILTMILGVSDFVRADATGDSLPAIRTATAGRIYGLQVVESPAITAGHAVAYHRSSFAFATRVPVPPRGATQSDTANYGGLGMRQIFQYQPDILSDVSVLSTFAGASLVDANRVYIFSKNAT